MGPEPWPLAHIDHPKEAEKDMFCGANQIEQKVGR
jgi:hypothetical protein